MSKQIAPAKFRCGFPVLEQALKTVAPAAGKKPKNPDLPAVHGVLLTAGEARGRVSAGDFGTTAGMEVDATGFGRALVDPKGLKALLVQSAKGGRKATLVAEVRVDENGEATLLVGPPEDAAAFDAPLECLSLKNYPADPGPSRQVAEIARAVLVSGIAHTASATGKDRYTRWISFVAFLFEPGLLRLLGSDQYTIGEAVLPAKVDGVPDESASGVLVLPQAVTSALKHVVGDRIAIGWEPGKRLSFTCGDLTVSTDTGDAPSVGFPVAKAREALGADWEASAPVAASLLLRDVLFASSAGTTGVELRIDGDGVTVRPALEERMDEMVAPPIPAEVLGTERAAVVDVKPLADVLKALGDLTVTLDLLLPGRGAVLTAAAPGGQGGVLRYRVLRRSTRR